MICYLRLDWSHGLKMVNAPQFWVRSVYSMQINQAISDTYLHKTKKKQSIEANCDMKEEKTLNYEMY